MKDHDYVNFSQDYELNYALRQLSKRQTQANRDRLIALGRDMKARTGKPRLQHGEFRAYARSNGWSLE